MRKITLNYLDTDDNRKKVYDRLSAGELAQSVRLDFINPRTKKPIDIDTFTTHFYDQIIAAKSVMAGNVSKNLYAGATYVGINKITGLEERDQKSMQQWLALCSRGIFGRKFDLDCDKDLRHQLKQCKQACADGMIGAQELTSFVSAIEKEAQLCEFEALKQEVAELRKLYQVK